MTIYPGYYKAARLLGVPKGEQSIFVRNMARYIKQTEKLGEDELHYGKREALLIKLASSTHFTIDKKDAVLSSLDSASENQLQKGIYLLRPILPVARRASLVSILVAPIPGIALFFGNLLLETASLAVEPFNSRFAKSAAQLKDASYLVKNICNRYQEKPLG
jgi:hypothetical protein